MAEPLGTIVYAANVDALADEKLYAAAFLAASDQRREKTLRLRSARDRRLSLGVELLLRKGLLDLGLDTKNLTYGLGENGKPFLRRPEGVCFNLSHSGSCVLCAISPWEVGCDVQRITAIRPGIAERFFAPRERELLMACEDRQEQRELFFRIWALKESYMKLTGLGMRLGLSEFAVDPKENCVVTTRDGIRQPVFFREYEIDGDYRCAVCCRQSEPEGALHKEDLARVLAMLPGSGDGGF